VHETNRYAEQKGRRRWNSMTEGDFYTFLGGLLIVMVCVPDLKQRLTTTVVWVELIWRMRGGACTASGGGGGSGG
jgi:hypothetical protein